MLTKKDTLLIGVLINSALLAILFITAIVYDVDVTLEETQNAIPLSESTEPLPPSLGERPIEPVVVQAQGDEVDNILNYYATRDEEELPPPLPSSKEFDSPTITEVLQTSTPASSEVVEITVKRGDSLDKIARANGTTVNAIKKLNQLPNEKLSVGQVLKVPVKKKLSSPAIANSDKSQEKPANQDAQYYILKPGDNPWKIAKQFNVKYEDILRLNQLDEDKARNLKAGDKIRIK